MGIIRKRVDDYLHNSKGEEVEEAEKRVISVPGIMFGGSRTVKHTLDLSPRGERAHDAERAKLLKTIEQACAAYLQHIGFDAKRHAAKQAEDGGAAEREDGFDSDDEEDSPHEQGYPQN